MSLYQNYFGVTIVKCLVTRKTNVEDMLYAATAVDHLACVTHQPNVSTAQVITLQTPNNAHNGRKRRKKMLKIKCENNISFPDARKQYKQFYKGQPYASAVKPSTCNKYTKTDDTSTKRDDNITEYTKEMQDKAKGTK